MENKVEAIRTRVDAKLHALSGLRPDGFDIRLVNDSEVEPDFRVTLYFPERYTNSEIPWDVLQKVKKIFYDVAAEYYRYFGLHFIYQSTAQLQQSA